MVRPGRCGWLAAIVLLAASQAAGAGRAATAKPVPAMLGAEIRGGADAAFGCQIGGEASPALDSAAFLRCVEGRQRANGRQLDRGDAPFDAGLWYMARERLRGLVAAVPSDLARSNLDTASAGLAAAERAGGVTDGDVWRALHARPGAGRPSDTGRARHRGSRPAPASGPASGKLR
jgi:hypothetical protein